MLVTGKTRLVTVTAFCVVAFIAIAALTYNPALTDDSSQYLRKSWAKISQDQSWLGKQNQPTPPGIPNTPQQPQDPLPFNPEPQVAESDLPSSNPNPYAAVDELSPTEHTTTTSSEPVHAQTSTSTEAAVGLPTNVKDHGDHTHMPVVAAEIPKTHDVLSSVTTANGNYFCINFYEDNNAAINPNILPHPTLNATWIAVAQKYDRTRTYPSGWSAELVCHAKFVDGGNLTCINPPEILTVAATTTTHCKDKLAPLLMNIGPHDARVLYGPDYPYLIYGSQSKHTCFGQWTQDFRLLMDWGLFRNDSDPYQVPTEIQRPPPLGEMEKNYYFFWDFDKVLYTHYDTSPKRAFAKLEADGSAGPDLAPHAYAHDEICWNKHLQLNPLPDPEVAKSSIHQATNSLSITFCKRSDLSCVVTPENTFIIAIYQHKVGNGIMHARYEPYVMVFKQQAPFEMHAISAKPLWIKGRASKEEMLYATSISWKTLGQQYHGYLDDVVFLNFGIEDKRTASIDVLAGDLVGNLVTC